MGNSRSKIEKAHNRKTQKTKNKDRSCKESHSSPLAPAPTNSCPMADPYGHNAYYSKQCDPYGHHAFYQSSASTYGHSTYFNE
jgi:uncharacterized protein YycO